MFVVYRYPSVCDTDLQSVSGFKFSFQCFGEETVEMATSSFYCATDVVFFHERNVVLKLNELIFPLHF